MDKLRYLIIIFAVAIFLVSSIYLIIPSGATGSNTMISDGIPQGAVHWHPKLAIRINGEDVNIPSNIGISVGRVVDTQISGMRMSPTHTHEPDGTIHLENNNPSSKPETLTLGYFFYVWGKQFNSSCVFDYCTDNGELKMYVNGQINKEFQNYMMHDRDQIVIEYESKSI